ncbi:MAG: dTMP kinase [Patescibacteria group bacterium]
MPGKFIVFEGGEASGKSTQIKILGEKLKNSNRSILITREPGGTDCVLAEKIRQILKDPANKEMCPETELFLFLASRAQHVKTKIMPILNDGGIVLCDRFFGSTLAYQHFGRGLFNLEQIKNLNNFATGGLIPDLTIYFDMDPKIALQRISNTFADDRFDSDTFEFHHRVRLGYQTLALTEPNWSVIDASQPIEKVENIIWQKFFELFVL